MKEIIQLIIKELQLHKTVNPIHSNYCDNLILKYSNAIDTLEKKENLESFLEWNKLFAPRIIYDGINNKNILNLISKLNSTSPY